MNDEINTSTDYSTVHNCHAIWKNLRLEADDIYCSEPLLRSLINTVVLDNENLGQAVACRLSTKLHAADLNRVTLYDLFISVYLNNPKLLEAIQTDLIAVVNRDPACHTYLQALLYLKGFHALQAHRIIHCLYMQGRYNLAYTIQSQVSAHTGVDIHPAAKIGTGIMFDHATGIVIGETAVVGDNVSILHGVTLGGTGKDDGDRHPKVGNNVLIGANASVLGNIRIHDCSRIASGSVVLKDVPANMTVAGVPARVVGNAGCGHPSTSMNQQL